MGSSFLTRDWTQVPCIGRAGSQPLDHQGSPSTLVYKEHTWWCLSAVLFGGRGQGQVEGWRQPGCPSLGMWSITDTHHQLPAAVRLESHRATWMSLEALWHSAEWEHSAKNAIETMIKHALISHTCMYKPTHIGLPDLQQMKWQFSRERKVSSISGAESTGLSWRRAEKRTLTHTVYNNKHTKYHLA